MKKLQNQILNNNNKLNRFNHSNLIYVFHYFAKNILLSFLTSPAVYFYFLHKLV